METLRNWGIAYVCVDYIEIAFSFQHCIIFFRLSTLCSARVSALVIVSSDSFVWKNRKMGDLSDF
jgi:hypothetical protein